MSLSRRMWLSGSVAALALLAFMPVNATASSRLSVSFFAGADGPVANGAAHWTTAISNDVDSFSMELDVPDGVGAPSFFSSFAGIDLHHIPSAAPGTPPSYDFMADKIAASGGSPRLVMQFSDGGDLELRPLAWSTTWTHEDGASTDWDVHSPTCPFLFETTYAAGLACHAGASVTGAFIVTDSGWLSAPYTNWIDNIQYDGIVISQPSDK